MVLYFFPAAFTQGCTIEAHNFAEATDEYKALGATVIGVSTDNIDTLNKFSVSECRGKFAVAADGDGKIMKSYDAVHDRRPEMAQRVSWRDFAGRQGAVFVHRHEPRHHVANTLRAFHAALPAGAPRRTSARRPRWATVYAFKLNEALKQGPVVLYFFPAAFTQGCTIEAHNFAEATDE